MLCEISSDTLLQGVTPQAPSVMSNRPGQASPPTGEELAKPMDSLQVTSSATNNNDDDKDDGDKNDDCDYSNDNDH